MRFPVQGKFLAQLHARRRNKKPSVRLLRAAGVAARACMRAQVKAVEPDAVVVLQHGAEKRIPFGTCIWTTGESAPGGPFVCTHAITAQLPTGNAPHLQWPRSPVRLTLACLSAPHPKKVEGAGSRAGEHACYFGWQLPQGTGRLP